MRRKRRILSFSVVLFFVAALYLPVSAHPGNTDAKGGHSEEDTGEYHYHHGYPAHSHYDTDGDGDIDCPYDFDDKTASFDSSITDKGSLSSTYVQPQKQNKGVSIVPQWVYWVFALQAVLIIILFSAYRRKKNEIIELGCKHRIKIESLQHECEEKINKYISASEELQDLRDKITSAKKELLLSTSLIAKEHKRIEQLRQTKLRVKNAPADITFTEDGMPIFWKQNPLKPYGDFTVYLNKSTNIYHIDKSCSPYSFKCEHIFNVIDSARPCRKCAVGFFNFRHAPEWFSLKEDADT